MREVNRRVYWVVGTLRSWQQVAERAIPPVSAIKFEDGKPEPFGFLQVYEREADAILAADGGDVLMMMVEV